MLLRQVTVYRDSFGDDWGDLEEAVEGFYRVPRPLLAVYFDGVDKTWKCKCRVFTDAGKCRHLYRFHREETVQVTGVNVELGEEFL